MAREAKSAIPDAPALMQCQTLKESEKDQPANHWKLWQFQWKYDGFRAVYDVARCRFTSRGRALLNTEGMAFPSLRQYLPPEKAQYGLCLDGEFYTHGMDFSELSSAIKNRDNPARSGVQFVVFDCFIPGQPSLEFWERQGVLDQVFERLPKKCGVIRAPCFSFTHSARWHAEDACSQGYEGIILRDLSGRYTPTRSAYVQKLKLFEDAEYQILSAEEGEGKNKKTLVFTLKTKTGETFTATSPGTYDKKKADFLSWEKAKAEKEPAPFRWARVRYQGLSCYGTPRFPVILALFSNRTQAHNPA